MLKLTEAAAAAIKEMLEDSEFPQGAGLRITAELDENDEPGLHLSFEAEPEDGDETVTEHGASVFLDPSAADALEDKLLIAQMHGDHAHFDIEDQGQ